MANITPTHPNYITKTNLKEKYETDILLLYLTFATYHI